MCFAQLRHVMAGKRFRLTSSNSPVAIRIEVNGEAVETRPAISLADWLVEAGYRSRYVAVEINRQVVPRARHVDTLLRDGDQLELVTLVGGG